MTLRLGPLVLSAILLTPAVAREKKKVVLPSDVLQAQTALVMIDPEAGEPLNQPYTNAMARENVEKALREWGRFTLVPEGKDADLIIVVRTSQRGVQPEVKGGPRDEQPVPTAEAGNSTIRIGGQRGQSPSWNDPTTRPPSNGPHVGDRPEWYEDSFQVYRGRVQYPLDASPVWRYVAKDCLNAPKVAAVQKFRETITKAEKLKNPTP